MGLKKLREKEALDVEIPVEGRTITHDFIIDLYLSSKDKPEPQRTNIINQCKKFSQCIGWNTNRAC